MANDPTQYQPARQQPPYQSAPYDRTQPASFQAPPPPYQPAPSYAPPPPTQNQPAQEKTGKTAGRSWLKDGIIGAVIIAAMLLTIVGVAFFAARAHSPSSIVSDYYASVKSQDYTKAFNYVHFPATTGNQGSSLYKAVAQALDKSRGPVSGYSEQSNTSSNGQTVVFETVQRNNSSYTVRLVLTKFNGEWRISSFTTI